MKLGHFLRMPQHVLVRVLNKCCNCCQYNLMHGASSHRFASLQRVWACTGRSSTLSNHERLVKAASQKPFSSKTVPSTADGFDAYCRRGGSACIVGQLVATVDLSPYVHGFTCHEVVLSCHVHGCLLLPGHVLSCSLCRHGSYVRVQQHLWRPPAH